MNQSFLSGKTHSRPLQRWLAWLLLGALSAFFAEVSGASSPLVFFDLFGLLVTVPLYTLHLLVLAPLVIRSNTRPSFSTLLLAGAIFGLYEAYITKVLWVPPWNPEAWRIGGIAVLEAMVLVLFWHPFMAFILPLLVGSRLLGDQDTLALPVTGWRWLHLGKAKAVEIPEPGDRMAPPSTPANLPRRHRWRGLWLAAPGALLGIVHGATVGNIGTSLLSTVSSSLLIAGLVLLWQGFGLKRDRSLAELLPNRRQWRMLAFLLLAGYLALGLVLRREALPGLPGQLTLWLLYLLFGVLLWRSARADNRRAPPLPEPSCASIEISRSGLRGWLWFSLGFVAVSALSAVLLAWAANGIYLLVWAFAIPVGLFSLGRVVLYLIRSRGKTHEQQKTGDSSLHPS